MGEKYDQCVERFLSKSVLCNQQKYLEYHNNYLLWTDKILEYAFDSVHNKLILCNLKGLTIQLERSIDIGLIIELTHKVAATLMFKTFFSKMHIVDLKRGFKNFITNHVDTGPFCQTLIFHIAYGISSTPINSLRKTFS